MDLTDDHINNFLSFEKTFQTFQTSHIHYHNNNKNVWTSEEAPLSGASRNFALNYFKLHRNSERAVGGRCIILRL